MKEKEGGAATVNEEQAVKAKNEDSGGARTVGIEHPPVGSSHRYKQTAKRRRSNEVTASERAATQKRLDRGFEDTEDADEEEEESDEEDEEEEGEAQGRGGGDANMLFMDSQVPILPKWKKLKGAKKHALKSALKPVSEDLPEDDSKSAQKRNRKEQPDAREAKPSKPAMAEAPKPATDRKESAAGKRQVAAKRPAEFAGVSGTKRKKVEGGIEEVKALPAAPESSKEPSAQAEGTGTGTRAEPDSAASGRRKRGQDVEKGANAIAGKGAEERDAKRARGPGGRVVSSRFRETPSRETTSGEAEKPQKQAQKGGVQKAASVPPQEAPGGRRRSSMVPIASLIRTRNRRGGEEKVEEGAEGMDIAFSQVPIASLREKKEVVGKGKLGAGTGPRGKKADVGGGKVGKKGTVAQAKGRAGSKRKAETLEEKSGLENAEVEEDIGMKKGVEVAAGAQDGETVPVATEMDATTEAAAGGKKSGGKTTEWAAGEENAKEGGTVNQSGVGEKKPVRKGRKTKGDVEVTETRRLDVDRGAEVPSEAGTGNGAGTGTVILTRTGTGTGIGTVKGQGASANVGAAEGGEIIVEDEPAAESKGKRTVGKRGRAAGKQGKAAQTHAKVEKEEKETGVPTANGEGERPTKRTRRGQLVTEGAEKKGVDPEVKAEPSKRVSSRGVRKTANEAKEKGPSRKRAPIEEVDEPENAEEAAGTSRSGRTSGENVGNQGGRGRLSVRVSGRVSDDLEGLVSPTLRKKREMGEVRVFVSSRMPDRMKAAQKKILKRMGAHEAQDVPSCTHLVAETFGRTQTMLEAIVGAKKIVTARWLESCGQASYFEDEEPHMLQDEKQEKKFNFSLKASLAAAKEKRIFEGLKVYITPNTTPDRNFFKSILEMGGGELLTRFTGGGTDSCLVVSSDKDKNVWEPLATKGIPVYTTELLMSAVVQQQLDTSRNLLSGGGSALHQTGAASVKGGGNPRPQRKGAAWR